MMQHYDFYSPSEYHSTNTSSKSAGTRAGYNDTILRPSPRVVSNILNYARCTQCMTVKGHRIRLCLN